MFSCPGGKFKDGSGRCDYCHPSCQQCSGPSKRHCFSCNKGYLHVSENRCYNDTCPGSTYLANPVLRHCVTCQYGCTFCKSPQFCYLCTPGFNLYRGWCYSNCPGTGVGILMSGYYNRIDGYICKPCHHLYGSKCLHCHNGYCKGCKTGYFLSRTQYSNTTENGINIRQHCFEKCPNGTYALKGTN